MKALLYFSKLSDLGKYKIEKTEDYDLAKQDGLDVSYYEYIRVRGTSSPNPSCVSKYSDTQLELYLKDHKKTWNSIAKLLNQDVDISNDEVMFIFSYQEFYKIDRIVHFVRKRIRHKEMNENERQKASLNIQKVNQKRRHISGKSEAKINGKRLDDYLCVEVQK